MRSDQHDMLLEKDLQDQPILLSLIKTYIFNTLIYMSISGETTMTEDVLTEFFGWCTVINIAIYLLTVISLALFRGLVQRINAKMFALSEEDVARVSFQYAGAYKLIITVFCFVPYLTLKIMS